MTDVRCRRQYHITPVLCSLHWLPISCGILYEVSPLRYCSLSESGPRYLSEILHTYTRSRQLRSSSDSFTLRVPTTNRKTFGERSFSFTGPTVWNSLPFDIHSKIPTLAFRQAPNTPFQQQVFCIQRNPAADLVTFLSSYIVHTLITCNFVILF